MSTKMNILWVVAPYSLVKFTNVSEVVPVSIIRAMMSCTRLHGATTQEDSHLRHTLHESIYLIFDELHRMLLS